MKLEDFGIYNYKFNPDGTLDVFQNVNLGNMNLTKLPFKFGKVKGNFWCNGNRLTSLKGAPEEVNGDFNCNANYIASLKSAPKIIKGDFRCNINYLKNIKYLNLDGISGKIYLIRNYNLILSEKDKLWMILNPGKIIR